MTNPKLLLDHYEISPKKSLGQNFLHDPNTLEKIVSTAELMPDDIVLEIGTGTGTLTEVLARNARHVFTIEVDERLRPILEEQLEPYRNVYMIYQDFLEVNVLKLVGTKPFVVVANVPYYITSPILRNLLELHRPPRRIIMTIQYEVAERIIVQPPDMNALAVFVQFYGKASIVNRLKPGVFWPRPEVNSAVLQIDTYTQPPVDIPSNKVFFRVVQAGFSQKRKQLRNALSGGLQIKPKQAAKLLEEAGIDSARRAETLNLEEWATLAQAYHRNRS